MVLNLINTNNTKQCAENIINSGIMEEFGFEFVDEIVHYYGLQRNKLYCLIYEYINNDITRKDRNNFLYIRTFNLFGRKQQEKVYEKALKAKIELNRKVNIENIYNITMHKDSDYSCIQIIIENK